MDITWYQSLEWFSKKKKVRKVLFVCSGNACRSPSAEYFFREMTHWWSGIRAFSRGTKVDETIAMLVSRGINLNEYAVEPEVKKAIGDRKTISFLHGHRPKQISTKDAESADLILTMEKSLRDQLRTEFPDAAYKIFTLKGFVEKTDNNSVAELDIGNPFMPPPLKAKQGVTLGKVGYYKYIQNYMKILSVIKEDVRKLIEILYLIRRE